MDMWRTWFDIDFLFDKDALGLIWYWFLAEEDDGADLVLTSLWRSYILYWGWFEIHFYLFFEDDVDFIFLVVEGVATGQPASQKSKAGRFWGSSPGELSWSGFKRGTSIIMLFQAPKTKIFFFLQYSLKNIFLLIRSLTRGEFTQTPRTRRVQLHLCWFVSTKSFSNCYFDYL